MLQPKGIWGMVTWLLCLASLGQSIPLQQACECGLFMRDPLLRPNHLVMTLENNLDIDCNDIAKALDTCKLYCANEVDALALLFERDPRLLSDYPPAQGISCDLLPQETFPFAKACNHPHYVLSSRTPGPSVCCNYSSNLPIWCGAVDISSNIVEDEGRKLDLKKDKNDESLNEIDTEISMLTKFDQNKKKPSASGGISPSSLMKTAIKFFGYEDLGDIVKSIDIFALPGLIQSASYRDELSMGQCYMEFTTFKVFTKNESPFEGLLRRKRSLTETHLHEEYEESDAKMLTGEYRSNVDTFVKIAQGLSGLLDKSDESRQYADLLNTFLPIASQLMGGGATSGGGGQGPNPLSMILKMAGPFLSQMSGSGRPRPPPPQMATSSSDFTKDQLPPRPPSSAGGNPLASMAMTMLGNVISNFFQPQGPMNRVQVVTTRPTTTTSTTTSTAPPTTTTRRPLQPMRPLPARPSVASQAISSLMGMFMNSRPTPVVTARPIYPSVGSLSGEIGGGGSFQEKQQKNFADVILEVIRPIFISILGNTPGGSGVKEIRRVSSLSTLGRVDDTLREEVDSPMFCLKKYFVNKAWSVTESGIRSIVDKLSPEERERMMQRMLS